MKEEREREKENEKNREKERFYNVISHYIIMKGGVAHENAEWWMNYAPLDGARFADVLEKSYFSLSLYFSKKKNEIKP